jgi:hypothetical protein
MDLINVNWGLLFLCLSNLFLLYRVWKLEKEVKEMRGPHVEQ